MTELSITVHSKPPEDHGMKLLGPNEVCLPANSTTTFTITTGDEPVRLKVEHD